MSFGLKGQLAHTPLRPSTGSGWLGPHSQHRAAVLMRLSLFLFFDFSLKSKGRRFGFDLPNATGSRG